MGRKVSEFGGTALDAKSETTRRAVRFLLVLCLILVGPCLSTARWLQDANRLLRQLPQETQDAIARNEAAGTTDSQEYRDATNVFYRRHLCRKDPWPPELLASLGHFGWPVYNAMWGPNEFRSSGVLRDYDRTPRLGELRLPVLFTAGRFDEATPEATAWYQSLVPGAKIAIFEKSAHMTMLEELDRYTTTVRRFQRSVETP